MSHDDVILSSGSEMKGMKPANPLLPQPPSYVHLTCVTRGAWRTSLPPQNRPPTLGVGVLKAAPAAEALMEAA